MEIINCTITFSTDVNSVKLSSSPLVNAFKQYRLSRKNRHSVEKKVAEIASSVGLEGWTLTKGLLGYYRDEAGNMYTERSVKVDLIQAPADAAEYFARLICREFKQESVLMCTFDYDAVDFITLNTKEQ